MTFAHRTKHPRPRGTTTFLTTVVVALTLVVFLPLVGPAGATDESVPDATPAVESNETPPDPDDGAGSDAEVTLDATAAEPTAVPSPPATPFGSIFVNVHGCPVAFDVIGVDLYTLAARCQETLDGVVFTLDLGYPGGFDTRRTGADGPGIVAWTEVEARQISLSAGIPRGYDKQRVFCAGELPGEDKQLAPMTITPSNQVFHNLRPGEVLTCDWFMGSAKNEGDETTGKIKVTAYVCSFGFDPAGAGRSEVLANCGGLRDGIQFSLALNAEPMDSRFTGDQEDGAAIWTGLPAGVYTIQEHVPGEFGLPTVDCQLTTRQQEGYGEYQRVPVDDKGRIALELPAGAWLLCDWFNVPASDVSIPLEPDAGTGRVVVHTRVCPEGYDHGADGYWLEEECRQTLDGVQFALGTVEGDGSLVVDTGTSGRDVAGRVDFTEVEPGLIRIVEVVPEGYGAQYVYCHGRLPGEVEVVPIGPLELAPGGVIEHELRPGEELTCYWHNAPAVEPDRAPERTDLLIYKHVCPAGFAAADATYHQLTTTCREPLDGIRFELTFGTGDSAISYEFVTGERGEPGAIGMLKVQPGLVRIEEQVPDGYGSPVVRCVGVFPGAPGERIAPAELFVREQAFVEYDLRAGETLYCDWFNVPAGGESSGNPTGDPTAGAIHVNVFACPAGTDPDTDNLDTLLANCTERMNGVRFTLDLGYPGGFENGTTGERGNGGVSWEGVEPRQVSLSQAVPPGYGAQIAFCRGTRPGETKALARREITASNQLFHDLRPSETFYCNWFNIPKGDASTRLYISKRICPLGVDAQIADIGDLAEDCELPLDGVEFVVERDNPGQEDIPPLRQVTGEVDWSSVLFEDVPPGTLVIRETVPPGYEDPVVYCKGRFDDELVHYERMALEQGNQIRYDLRPGEEFLCLWFNVPVAEPDPAGDGSIQVTTRRCSNAFDAAAVTEVTREQLFGLAVGCEVTADGTSFTLTRGDEAIVARPGGATEPGVLRFEGLHAGMYDLQAKIPAGYGRPLVLCAFVEPGVATPFEAIFVAKVSGGDRVAVELKSGQHLSCEWFNVPLPDEVGPIETPGAEIGFGAIYVNKYRCPEPLVAEKVVLSDLMKLCREPMDGVAFHLTLADGTELTQTTGQIMAGMVAWEDVLAREFLLQEEVPAGYADPIVYCTGYRDGEIVRETYSAYETAGGFDDILQTGEMLLCDWFNIPAADEQAPASVHVRNVACPTGFPAYSANRDQLLDRCTEASDGVRFTVAAVDADAIYETETGKEVSSVAWFAAVQPGRVLVTQTPPEGYGEPIVFCAAAQPGEQNPMLRMQLAPGPAIESILPPGGALRCDWIDVPAATTRDGSHVLLRTHTCPVGFDADEADLSALTETCRMPLDGVLFGLHTGGDDLPLLARSGDEVAGAALFGLVPPGEIRITEMLPDGFGPPIVFCESTLPETRPRATGLPTTTTTELKYQMREGEQVVCDWFNVPLAAVEASGSVTVVKYWCDGLARSVELCRRDGGGAEFRLVPVGQGDVALDVVFPTEADGSATAEVPAGRWLLEEIGAEWCGISSDDANGVGEIVIRPGQESQVIVFNCAAPSDDDKDNPHPSKHRPLWRD